LSKEGPELRMNTYGTVFSFTNAFYNHFTERKYEHKIYASKRRGAKEKKIIRCPPKEINKYYTKKILETGRSWYLRAWHWPYFEYLEFAVVLEVLHLLLGVGDNGVRPGLPASRANLIQTLDIYKQINRSIF
jgi:hypothetical protein